MKAISNSSLKKETLRENRTITVGVGKDYENIDDALIFASSLKFVNGAALKIVLDDGTHTISENHVNEEGWAAFVFYGVTVYIESASGDKSLCKIKIEYNNEYEYLDNIAISRSSMSFNGISFDGYDENNVDIKRWLINVYEGSSVYISDCDFNHFYGPIYASSSVVGIYGDIKITGSFSAISMWDGDLSMWSDNSSGDTILLSDFYEYGEPNTNWVRGISVRGNSYFSIYSDMEISGPPLIDKIFNGWRIDESSRVYIDGKATHKFFDCKSGIKLEGGSTIGTEQRDYVAEFTDCIRGFEISYSSSVYLRNEPIFTNVDHPYYNTSTSRDIPPNVFTNDNCFVNINRVNYEVENGFTNYEDGSAELKNADNSKIFSRGAKAIPTIEYVEDRGATTERPTEKNIGRFYFDTDISKPIWWNGTDWIDAVGNIV